MARTTAITVAVVAVVAVFGVLWRHNIHGSGGASTLGNFTTVPDHDGVLGVKELDERISELTRDADLGRLWHGLLQLQLGNRSLEGMRTALTGAAGNFSRDCTADLLLAIENVAATGLYAASCRFDHADNHTHASQCFESHTADMLWAAHLFDAWGKPPAGVASSGPFFLMGDYDQCLAIRIPQPDAKESKRTQYCRADIRARDPFKTRSVPLTYGICVPASCQKPDLEQFVRYWTDDLMAEGGLTGDGSDRAQLTCFTADDDRWNWTNAQIVYLCVIVVIVVVILLASFVELCFGHGPTFARAEAGCDVDRNSDSCSLGFIPLEGCAESDHWTERIEAGADILCPEPAVSVANAPSVALTYKPTNELRQTFSHGSFLAEILGAFSVRRSLNHLLRESGTQINSLHGLRVLSAVWVIIGHAHLLSIGFIGNPKRLIELIRSYTLAQWIFNSSLAVDSFFLMAGSVLAFSFRRRLIIAKNDQNRLTRLFAISRWFIVYCHRWLRLMPAYVVVLGGTVTMYNRLGNGPMWDKENGVFGSKCQPQDWWQHLLFVLNFFPSECMPWMWYLSVDTQFYLVAPLCIFLLYKVPAFGRASIVLGILGSAFYRFAIYYVYQFPANVILKMLEKETVVSEEAAKMFGLVYSAPQARVGPFLIGILLGWALAVKQKVTLARLQKGTLLDCVGVRWLLRMGSVVLLLWAVHGGDLGPLLHPLYTIFYASQHRIAWSLGLAGIVWLCERGHLEPVANILGWDKWVPLSRLCFGVYLSHELIIIASVYQRRKVWLVEGPGEVITFALGVTLLSVLAAVVLAVLVEIPPLTLERKLFMRIRKNVAIRKNDKGNLTVSEAARSLKTLKRWRREKRCISESSTRRALDSGSCSAVFPHELPVERPTNKVKQWLNDGSTDGDDCDKHNETDKNDNDADGGDMFPPRTERLFPSNTNANLNKLYPWDDERWHVDSRAALHADPSSTTQSPTTLTPSSMTQVVDVQECVPATFLNASVAKIVKQEPAAGNLTFYDTTEA